MLKASYDGTNKKLLWQEMWRHEFEAALKQNPVVIVPTGSIEQHGPHCPVDVDISGPFAIATEVAKRINEFPVIVAPPVWWGFSHYNMGFPGTITLRADTYRNLLKDILKSINANGFQRIVVLNGHGGNEALNKSIMSEVSEENIFIVAFSWWQAVEEEMRRLSTADDSVVGVGHGGEVETSLQLYLRPHMIHKASMNADMPLNKMAFSPELRRFAILAETRRDSVEHTGTRGNALAGTEAKGKAFFEAATSKLEKVVREFHDQPIRNYRQFGSHCP